MAWMKTLFSALALAVVLAASGQPFPAAFEGQVDIGSHRLHVLRLGEKPPTVVLDVGIGESYQDWLPLLNKIAARALVVAYDRAGYGRSEIGPFPRTSERAADELKALLDKAGIPGPYVLVGHSLGALNLQVFAHKYGGQTAGILLLDPPPLDWILGQGFPGLLEMAKGAGRDFAAQAQAAERSARPEDRGRAGFFRTLASEHDEFMSPAGARSIASIPSFGDKPLVVVAAGRANPLFGPDADAYQKFWNEQCRKLVAKSSRGEYVLAAESRHHIHRDAPDLVLRLVNRMLDELDPQRPGQVR